jgi:glycosyltransferase involved in cell wall biosynthesis
MKVLILTNYLGNRGGLGRYSHEVVKALSIFPIEMKVLTENDILLPTFRQKKFIVIKNIIINIWRTWKSARKFDVIHAHDGWPYALYAYFSVIGTSKKLFITGIGTYTVAPLQRGLRGFIMKTVYRRAQAIFCISDYVKNKILEKVPEAYAITVFMGTTALPEVESVGDTYPIILTVGDIKHRKGQLDTLKSLNLLKEKYSKFKYIMVGDDADVYYINLIKEFALDNNLLQNIQIISRMYDDKTLASYYSMCNIFMLNSNNDGEHFEGFGLALLEAAQFGKPVIGSRGCGIESALENCYNGFLTDQGNHSDIARRIEDVMGQKDTLGSHSREFYKRFSWKKTIQEYLKHY